jgi:hypothetical protein
MSQRTLESEPDDDRKSRTSRKRSGKRPGNRRNALLGFLGCGGLLALFVLVAVGVYTFTVIAPIEAQLPDNALPIVVNLVRPFQADNVSLTGYTLVHADAIGEDPIQLMQLWADGVAVDAQAATPKESLYTTEFSWRPTGPGNHTLLVIAVDVNGQSAISNLALVNAFPESPQLAQVPVGEGDTIKSVAEAFDLTPDQVVAINPQIALPIDLPLPPNTTLTVLPPSGALIPTNPKPPIPPDTSLLPPPPQPPTGTVPPAPTLPNNPVGLFTQLVVASPPKRPAAPILTADVEGCSVILYFTDQSSDEAGFQVYRANPGSTDFKKIAALDASKTTGTTFSFTDPGRYGRSMYYVSAFNGAGESQSTPAQATIFSQTCTQPDQVGLAVQSPQIRTAQPLERAFCYAALGNNGPWSRMPSNPESYVYPEGGVFDFSPYLNALVSPPPTVAVVLSMRCGGFAGDALIDLGVGQQTIQPNSNNQPFQLTAEGFTLTATLNFGQAQAPVVLPPPPAEPSHDRFIAPPYDVVVFTNPDTGERTLIWRWRPSPPCDPTAPECTDIIDITGFRVYGVNLTSHEVKVVTDGLAPAQRQFKLPPLTGDNAKNGTCYSLVAYQDIYESRQAETCVDGLGGPAPHPLPSANIPAPTNLRMTGDVAVCQSHFEVKPVDWKKNNACAPLAITDSQQRAFVWEWSNSLCQPGSPGCQTITDIDGYHVYVDVNGQQRLLGGFSSTTKATVQFYSSTNAFNCFVVRAYKGNLESASSNRACMTFSDVGFTAGIVPPTSMYAFGSTYAGATCDPITSTQTDTPGPAQAPYYWFSRNPYGFAVGYMHLQIGPDPACPQLTTMWREGLVAFDLGQMGSTKIQKATLLFQRGRVQNFYDSSGLFPDDFVANAAANENDCATSLDTVVSATSGGLYRNGQLVKTVPGSLFTGSQQVVAAPLSATTVINDPDDSSENSLGIDVTGLAQSVAQSQGKILSLLFATDTARTPETASCLSFYSAIGLKLEVAP